MHKYAASKGYVTWTVHNHKFKGLFERQLITDGIVRRRRLSGCDDRCVDDLR